MRKRVAKPGICYALGALILALFFVSLTPVPASAQCCNPADSAALATIAKNTTQDSTVNWLKDLGVLGDIFKTISDTLNFFQSLLAPLLGQGFGAVTAAITGTNMGVAGSIYNLGDFLNQNGRYNNQIMQTADQMKDATLPSQSAACQWAQASITKQQMDQSVAWIAAAHGTLQAGDCRGGQANCPGPGRKWEQLSDLCQLGFIKTSEYGDLLQNQNCTTPPEDGYVDRDENFAAGLAALQMPLPPNACVLPDGYVSFSGPPPGSGLTCKSGAGVAPGTLFDGDPTKSALAWIAFYKACENLDSDEDIPSVYATGRGATTLDVGKIMDGRKLSMAKGGLRGECIKALWERTACPQGSGAVAQAVGGAMNCADVQLQHCKNMANDVTSAGTHPDGGDGNAPTWTSNDSGVGIKDDPYLQGCLNNGTGLSPLMRDSIEAHRCSYTSYLSNGLANRSRDSNQLEHDADFPCREAEERFAARLRDESAALIQLLSGSQRWRQEYANKPAYTSP